MHSAYPTYVSVGTMYQWVTCRAENSEGIMLDTINHFGKILAPSSTIQRNIRLIIINGQKEEQVLLTGAIYFCDLCGSVNRPSNIHVVR